MAGGLDEELAARQRAGRFARRSEAPSGAGLEEHVAELRALRERLAGELELMERKVDELARVRDARPRVESGDAERIVALQAKLREIGVALEASRQMRLAVTDHLVGHQHVSLERPAVEALEPERRQTRGRLPFARAGVLAGGALGALAAGSLLGDDGPSPSPAPPAPVAAAPAPPRVIPPCAELPAGAGSNGTVWCTTGTTLGKAAGTSPLVMEDVEARALRVTRAGDSVVVRLRVRNATSSPQRLARRIYLSLPGRRAYPAASGGTLAAGAVTTLSLRFRAGGTTVRQADLGVLPFEGPADPDRAKRVGVISLTLPPA